VRRECLDHVLVLGERHLCEVLVEYCSYFNEARPHQGIGQLVPRRRHAARHRGAVAARRVFHSDHERRRPSAQPRAHRDRFGRPRVLGERHLLRLVREHALYYNADRPYMSPVTHRSGDPLSHWRSDELLRYRASKDSTIGTREQRERHE
jgi:hypothetical protein